MEFDEFDEQEVYIANLLKRHYLNDGTYIFTHVTSISGRIEEDGYLIDDLDREYAFIDNQDAYFEQNEYIVADVMTKEEAKELTDLETEDIEEILYQYDVYQNTKYYLGSINANLNITTFKFDYESMISSLYGNVKEDEIETSVEESKEERLSYIKEAIQNMNIIDRRYYYEDGIIDVDSVFKDVTKTVIGQDEPIKRLLAEIARMEMGMQKQAIVLSANSGVGTSMTLRIIAKDLNKELVEIDSADLSGEILIQIKDKLSKVDNKSSIVFFDKINKVKDIEKLMKEVSKLIDGKVDKLDTSNMIFIIGGDFYNENGKKICNDIPIKIRMNNININGLKSILEKSDRSPIIIQKDKFKKLGVDLKFTNKAINKLATQASYKNTGAKALEEVVAEVTYKPFYKAITNLNKIENITITDKTVEDNNSYKVKRKK